MPAMAPLPVSMPLPGTLLVSEPGHTVTGKRRREDDLIVSNSDASDISAPKRQAKAHDVLFRIVVPSKQIGKVIGKVGCRIQKVREETKATIKIADAVAVLFLLFFILCALGVRVFGFAMEEVLIENLMYRRGFFFFLFCPLNLLLVGGFLGDNWRFCASAV